MGRLEGKLEGGLAGGVCWRWRATSYQFAHGDAPQRDTCSSANNRERALLMPTIVEGVDFDTVAREWRCKWSADNDKASLAAAQALLVKTKPDIAAVKGVKEVKRIVCGGCLDFKVIIALDAAVYGDWEAQVNEVSSVTPITAHQMLNSPLPVRQEFAPEKAFLEALGSIPGISNVETQTFTIMTA